MTHSILWRRLDQPGHESARLLQENNLWTLNGVAVFSHDGQPCRLDYEIVCDSRWYTLSARVTGWVGDNSIAIDIAVNSEQHWLLNQTRAPEVEGCIDLDLNFSPSTNLLPIRRLNLPVGQEAEVRAAWLRFPSFKLEPLTQIYRRIDETNYRYESAGGKFVTNLLVNADGLVRNYPNTWEVES
jgi:hypothetical protein